MEWHIEGNVIVLDDYDIRDTPAQRWADLMAVRIELPKK